MKISVTFEEGDFNSLHDIMYEINRKKLQHNELQTIWNSLPEDIKEDGIHWGLDDSVVRDKMYVYLKQIYKNG
jgi:hypothetical protein